MSSLPLFLVLLSWLATSEAQLGINYGRVANNLPSPSGAVFLIKLLNFNLVKLFDADAEVLSALANTNLKVSIMVMNQDIVNIANNPSQADAWVTQNVVPFYPRTQITTILVGNEVLSDYHNKEIWFTLVTAMRNIHSSLSSRGLSDVIKVSTSLAHDVLSSSYPPSAGEFRADISSAVITPLLTFLSDTGSTFHATIYPYYPYAGNQVSLEYATFASPSVVVQDGSYSYWNLLDAMTDALYVGMEKLGYGNIPLVISETGWPSGGGPGASVVNAQNYNSRLVRRVASSQGTPRRPGVSVPTYIFALFNEDEKSGGEIERNFGLLYPNGFPVYTFR